MSKTEPEVAVVTGGGGGIGSQIVVELCEKGFTVAVWDLDEDRAGEVASAACDMGGRAVGMAVDISRGDDVRRTTATVEDDLGPIYGFVNNAGIDEIGPFLESTGESWQRIIDTNLIGTITCCHVVLPLMKERGRGSVVNLGSDAGRVGSSGEAVYSATKGGVIAFTKAIAREMARYGVTVNCVCPGPTDTALLDQVAAHSPKLYQALERAIPMGRIGRPDDVAPVVRFFLGSDAAFVTGQCLSVSGGLTMC